MTIYLTIIIITSLIMIIAKKLIYDLLINSKAIKKNYLGQEVPVGFGIIIPIASICSLTIINLFFPLDRMAYIFLLGIIFISFLGAIDDLLGNRDTSGLKGHIGKLLKLELTTGGLKAVIGGIIAVFVSMPFESNLFIVLLNSFIIALFTNFLNLLDLRPGRAIKGYLLVAFILTVLFLREHSLYLLVMITTIVLMYFPLDIKALAMMGDAGSNVLGFTLGFFSTRYFSPLIKLTVLILLILIHVIAEKSSITKIIEKNSFLNFLDQLGR